MRFRRKDAAMEEFWNTLAVVVLANLAALPWALWAWRRERPTKAKGFRVPVYMDETQWEE